MSNTAGNNYRLGTGRRVMYGMGNMGGNFLNLTFSMWLFKRYCPPAGEGETLTPILWLTYAFIAGRIVDAVADPLIGYWSDNTRSRWGRRIPFMAIGGLPLCIVFFLIWAPPLSVFPANSVSLFAYLCAVMGVFWFLFTAVLCPYLALLPEIAVSTSDRLNLATYQSVFMLASSGVAMVIGPFIVGAKGFVAMGAVFTVLAFFGLYAPVVSIRERYKPQQRGDQQYGMFTALKWSFSNRPFVIYLISNVFCQLGFNMIIMSMSYIVTVILEKSDSFVGIIMGGTGAFAVVSFFLINRLVTRYDKRKVYMAGMLAMAVLLPLIWVFGRYDVSFSLGFLGLDYRVSELAVAFLAFTLTGFPVAVLMVLPPIILADVIDLDELKTGERREAMYFGAQGLLQKAGAGLSGGIMSFLFATFGYSAASHVGIDLLGPVTAILVFIGFFIFLPYPLDRAKIEEIKRQLEERSGRAAP